jgi:hypothetical protein
MELGVDFGADVLSKGVSSSAEDGHGLSVEARLACCLGVRLEPDSDSDGSSVNEAEAELSGSGARDVEVFAVFAGVDLELALLVASAAPEVILGPGRDPDSDVLEPAAHEPVADVDLVVGERRRPLSDSLRERGGLGSDVLNERCRPVSDDALEERRRPLSDSLRERGGLVGSDMLDERCRPVSDDALEERRVPLSDSLRERGGLGSDVLNERCGPVSDALEERRVPLSDSLRER